MNVALWIFVARLLAGVFLLASCKNVFVPCKKSSPDESETGW